MSSPPDGSKFKIFKSSFLYNLDKRKQAPADLERLSYMYVRIDLVEAFRFRRPDKVYLQNNQDEMVRFLVKICNMFINFDV